MGMEFRQRLDALIGDCSDKSVRGRSYGLINSMKIRAAFWRNASLLLAGYISKKSWV